MFNLLGDDVMQSIFFILCNSEFLTILFAWGWCDEVNVLVLCKSEFSTVLFACGWCDKVNILKNA